MGQDASKTIQLLNKEGIIICLSCKKQFNLSNRMPIMVCQNQHNYCQECLQEIIKSKKCYECKDGLLLKRKRNNILCFILQKLGIQSEFSEKPFQKNSIILEEQTTSRLRRNESSQGAFKTLESPQRKSIKIKAVKQQSIPNLNLDLYNEQRQFRKRYSVASIFSTLKQSSIELKKRNNEETPQQILQYIAEEYKIIPFKSIIQQKAEFNSINNLDLHLFKIPKIFPILGQFKSLIRLNLTKNKISKIQNLEELKQLSYLSLSQNQIEIIENLSDLINLKNLYLNRNRIQRIQNLQELVNLEFLGLGFNAIQKIENINHLIQLKWLNLECNYISKIQGIINLKKLQIIMLGSNNIIIFQGFENFPALQEIHIQNNKIIDLGRALSMKHLRKIKLEDNPGLNEGAGSQYLKLLEIIEAKSKGIEKPDGGCDIY